MQIEVETNVLGTRTQQAVKEIMNILEKAGNNDNYKWQYITVTDFKKDNEELSEFSTEIIGKALRLCGLTGKRIKINNKVHRVIWLPLKINKKIG